MFVRAPVDEVRGVEDPLSGAEAMLRFTFADAAFAIFALFWEYKTFRLFWYPSTRKGRFENYFSKI